MFYLLGCFVLLGGCSLIPEYTQPEPPMPATWPSGTAYEEPVSRQDKPTAADLQWQDFFSDESLSQIIDMALQNNRDLQLVCIGGRTKITC